MPGPAPPAPDNASLIVPTLSAIVRSTDPDAAADCPAADDAIPTAGATGLMGHPATDDASPPDVASSMASSTEPGAEDESSAVDGASPQDAARPTANEVVVPP